MIPTCIEVTDSQEGTQFKNEIRQKVYYPYQKEALQVHQVPNELRPQLLEEAHAGLFAGPFSER